MTGRSMVARKGHEEAPEETVPRGRGTHPPEQDVEGGDLPLLLLLQAHTPLQLHVLLLQLLARQEPLEGHADGGRQGRLGQPRPVVRHRVQFRGRRPARPRRHRGAVAVPVRETVVPPAHDVGAGHAGALPDAEVREVHRLPAHLDRRGAQEPRHVRRARGVHEVGLHRHRADRRHEERHRRARNEDPAVSGRRRQGRRHVRRAPEEHERPLAGPLVHVEGRPRAQEEVSRVIISPDSYFNRITWDHGCDTSSIIVDADGFLWYPCRVLEEKTINLIDSDLMTYLESPDGHERRVRMAACDIQCAWYQYYATQAFVNPREILSAWMPYYRDLLNRGKQPVAVAPPVTPKSVTDLTHLQILQESAIKGLDLPVGASLELPILGQTQLRP